VKPAAESGAVVPVAGANAEDAEPLDPFGDLIPFADPTWYQGVRISLPFLIVLWGFSMRGGIWFSGIMDQWPGCWFEANDSGTDGPITRRP
jgi:hypothetical protein